MKKFRITIVDPSHKLTEFIKTDGKSDNFTIKKTEYTDEDGFSEDAVEVFYKGQATGAYVANREETLLNGGPDYKASQLIEEFPEIENGISIKIISANDSPYRRYVVEFTQGDEKVEREENKEAFTEIRINGGLSAFPARKAILLEISEGKVLDLNISKEDKKLFYISYGDEPIGFVKKEDLGLEAENLSTNKSLTLETVRSDRSVIIARAVKALPKIAENLRQEVPFLSDAEFADRVAYMEQYNVSAKTIKKIFEGIEEYPAEVAMLIPPKPEVPFVDSDGILQKALSNVNISSNLIFEGLMGTGKNVLCETIAWLTCRPLYELSMNSQVSNMDLLGSNTLENGEVKFVPSAIINAFEYGGVLVLDEFNIAMPHVLSVFNSLLDERRRINVPGYKVVEGHKNFLAIATQNPGYIGTFPGNQATKNRFFKIIFSRGASIEDIISSKVCGISEAFLDVSSRLMEEIEGNVKNGELSPECLNIRGLIRAARLYQEEDFSIKDSIAFSMVNSIEDETERSIVSGMLDAFV